MPKIPKPLDSKGIYSFFFENDFEKNTPEFLKQKLRIIHFYLNDDENGWFYDRTFFERDFAHLNVIYMTGVEYIIEIEGDYFQFNYLSSVEVALAERRKLSLQLRCEPRTYIALLGVGLIMRYVNLTQNAKDVISDETGYLLLEIGRIFKALSDWSHGSPTKGDAFVKEMRLIGKAGVASREAKKQAFIERFVESFERGAFGEDRSVKQASQLFVRRMTSEEKSEYRHPKSNEALSAEEIDIRIARSIERAYGRQKKSQ